MKINKPKKINYYLGIDLGTSNSSIAYGVPNNLGIKIVNIPIPQMVSQRGMENRELVPSVIYIKNGRPIIGEYAKEMIINQPSKVIKSIKSIIGTNETIKINDKEFTPAELSSYILRFLKKSAEKLLQNKISDVVIAVPASFDADMRRNTLQAAEKAGFNVEDDILLDEPRATLFDLLNKQLLGELPANILEYNSEKIILIYDIGGGTLDVSIHSVLAKKDGEVAIKDIAISRYSLIGGDNFDELVAEWLKNRFLKENPDIDWNELSQFEQQEVNSKLYIAAEKVKFDLVQMEFSSSLEDDWGSDWGNDQINAATISTGYLIRDRMLYLDITLEEYEEIIKDLLDYEVKLEDYENITLTGKNSIITPIIDVLKKAHSKFNTIDMVLMTGGMTKFPSVKNRLRNFFNTEPITIVDPDKSVSRGAVAYSYLRNRGYSTDIILAETISLGISGGKVIPLIKSGEKLPVSKNLDHEFTVPVNSTSEIFLPLYRGENTIANRNTLIHGFNFNLKKPYPKDTIVKVKINMNINKILSFEAWLKDKPEIRFIGDVSSDRSIDKNIIEYKERKIVKSPVYEQNIAHPIDINKTINEYIKALRSTEKNAKKIEDKMNRASNSDKIIPHILSLYRPTSYPNSLALKRLPIILSNLFNKHPTHKDKNEFIKLVLLNLSVNLRDNEFNFTTRIFGAIRAVGKLLIEEAEDKLLNLFQSRYINKILTINLSSLAKISTSKDAAKIISKYLTHTNKGTRIVAIWGIGKISRLDVEYPLDRRLLTDPLIKFHKIIQNNTKILNMRNHQLLRNVIYAIGEICDTRIINRQRIKQKYLDEIVSDLKKFQNKIINSNIGKSADDLIFKQKMDLFNLSNMVISMILGIKLDKEQESILLSLRTK